MHIVPAEVLARHDYKIPNYIAPSVRDINFEHLQLAGIKHLLVDIDNTLVTFGQSTLHPRAAARLREARQQGLFRSLSIATNRGRRIDGIVDVIQPDFTFHRQGLVMKPLPAYYRRVAESIGDHPSTMVMIGDKLVQDVWGARRAGMSAVLVKPLGSDFWLDRIFAIRWREKRLLRGYLPQHPEHWF